MKLKIVGIVIVCILLASFVAAKSFDATIEPIKDSITINEEAHLLLTISNNLKIPDDYDLSFKDMSLWSTYYSEPLGDYLSGIKNVGGESRKKTKLFLKPIAGIGVGIHEVTIEIKSIKTGDVVITTVPIAIKSLHSEQFLLPHVNVGASIPENLDPRIKNAVSVVLENRNQKNITKAELTIDSALFDLVQYVDLAPLERKEISIPLVLDKRQHPSEDTLKITLRIDKYTFESEELQFKVMDYTSLFTIKDSITSSFLLTINDRTYTNDGNSVRTQTVTEETSLLTELFKSSTPAPHTIMGKDGKRFRAWEFTLKPGESTDVQLTTNYRIFLYLLLLIIVLGILYVLFKSPLEVKKSAKNIEMREGGVSEVKIMLSIRNIGKTPIEHIEVMDEIPNIANISKDFDAGVIRPSRILKHEGKGSTIVEWKIEELDPNEDRVLTYKIKSRLSILGQFSLPAATVKFQHTKGGKRHRVSSKRLHIGA